MGLFIDRRLRKILNAKSDYEAVMRSIPVPPEAEKRISWNTYIANGNGKRSTISAVIGKEVFSEIFFVEGEKINSLSCSVTTAGSSTLTIRFGLRLSSVPFGGPRYPDKLVTQTEPIAAGTTGIVTGTFDSSYVIPETGIYYVGTLIQGGDVQPTLRSYGLTNQDVRYTSTLSALLGASEWSPNDYWMQTPMDAYNLTDPMPEYQQFNLRGSKAPVVVAGVIK